MSNWQYMIRQCRAKGGLDRYEQVAFDDARAEEAPRKLNGILRARQDRALREFGDAIRATFFGKLFDRMAKRVFG